MFQVLQCQQFLQVDLLHFVQRNVNLIASTSLSYLWSNGSTDHYINVTNAGSYVVTVTTAAGTTTSSPVAVTVYSLAEYNNNF